MAACGSETSFHVALLFSSIHYNIESLFADSRGGEPFPDVCNVILASRLQQAGGGRRFPEQPPKAAKDEMNSLTTPEDI